MDALETEKYFDKLADLEATPRLLNAQSNGDGHAGQAEQEAFIYATIDHEDREAVILVTEDGEKLFSAHTAAEAAAEMLVRGIRDYYCSSTMDFSHERGWSSPSARDEISRHFGSLEGMARQRRWIDMIEGEGGIFEVVDALLLEGASQRELSGHFADILKGMEIADDICGCAA